MKFALALLLSGCLYGNGTIQQAAPPVAEAATYYVLTPDLGQCTAWGVAEGHAMTAGHCCHEDGTYTLISDRNRHVEATVVRYNDVDHEDRVPLDACLLQTESPIRYLDLATKMPEVGDYVQYVGYPKGKWIHSEGFYKGDIDGPYQFWNDHHFTAPCDKGASGSAVLNSSGQVWGILVRLAFLGEEVYPGTYGCIASPLSQIHQVLD